MKKTFTLWAMLMLIAFCSQAVLTLPRPVGKSEGLPRMEKTEVGSRYKIVAPTQQAPAKNYEDDDASIYAYRLYAALGELHGWYNFSVKYPADLTMVRSHGNEAGDYGVMAATHAKGKTYAYIFQHYGSDASGWNDWQFPVGIATYDETTGEYEIKFDTSENFHLFDYNQIFTDMAYDPVTDKIYACEFDYDSDGGFTNRMNIYTIDPETCAPTLVGKSDCVFTAMAADNGKIYGLTQLYDEEAAKAITRVVSFDPTNVNNNIFETKTECDIIGGENIVYSVQTMEFDLTTHRLYWLGFRQLNETNIKGFITEIDIEKGRLIGETEIPYSAQYTALTIPYQIAADDAPARVKNLKVTPASNGGAEATITWTNPTETYQLNTLTSLTGVKIYRNDELIHTYATTEPGANVEYKDQNVPSGIYTYKLVPYNEAGDGIAKEYSEFIGQDIPSEVLNLNANVNLDEVTITWDAPTIGANTGWINVDELKYDVYRGTYKLASEITERTITDKVNQYKAYEYRVVPATNAGVGNAESITVAFGPAVELPYENKLDSEERAMELISIENDGNGVGWEYSEGYQGYVYSSTMSGGELGDDYLVLPHMELTKGKKYQIRFYYYTSNYGDNCVEKLQVLVGKGQKPENLKTVVEEFSFIADMRQGATWHETCTEYMAEDDGLHNFAFKCTTEEVLGFIIVSWIEVREMSDVEAEGVDITGPSEVYEGIAADYVVTVHNIGVTDIAKAAVKLLNIDGKVLAETQIENLLIDEVRDVVVTWTPTEPGSYKVYGTIRADGDADQYTWDNTTATFVPVIVNGADSDKWVVIGKDRLDAYDDRLITLDRSYSRSQWFYYSDEIGSDLTITGIRLHYSASKDAELLTEVPLVVRMMNTDRDVLIDSGYGYDEIFEPQENMTVVFDGTIDLSGTNEETNILEIKLDNQFEYTASNNLLVEFDKEWDEKYESVKWHFDINPKYQDRQSGYKDYWGDPIYYGRGGFFCYNVPYDEDPFNTATDFFPHIKFSYPNTDSIDTINTNSNLSVIITENSLIFAEECEFVDMYSISGAKVASAMNVNSISTENLVSGVYVVKAVVNGEILTKKVMIK